MFASNIDADSFHFVSERELVQDSDDETTANHQKVDDESTDTICLNNGVTEQPQILPTRDAFTCQSHYLKPTVRT